MIGATMNTAQDSFTVPRGMYQVNVFVQGLGATPYAVAINGVAQGTTGSSADVTTGTLGLNTVVTMIADGELSVVVVASAQGDASGTVGASRLFLTRMV